MVTLNLTDEMRRALDQHPDRPLELHDEQTQQVYLLIRKPAGPEMIHATDHEAIQAGIDDMEAGRCVPFEEVDRRISAKLGIDPLK